MGKLSKLAPQGATSTITTEASPSILTAEGGPGYIRDAKSELFLLAVSNFVSEAAFYESAQARDDRFSALVRQLAVEDFDWLSQMLTWLRADANMRSASIVGAVEAGVAASASAPRRALLASVMLRADEPGEALGYWLAKYGRKMPKWFKRAIGDGAVKLYTEYSALKYDTNNSAVRFADVIELSQIERGRLDAKFAKWLLDRRRKRTWTSSEGLPMVQQREALERVPVAERPAALDASILSAAGASWEYVAGWIQGAMTAKVWEALIPSMGYMALLRNLRNFDEAGVSDEIANTVISKLSDPSEVMRSRQLPMRFLSAYNAAPSDRWKHPLSIALDTSLAALPTMQGDTIVLVDVSGSMGQAFSRDGSLHFWEAAALFGVAFAKRNSARVFAFSTSTKEFTLTKGASTLRELEAFKRTHFEGGGTQTATAIRQARAAMPTAKRIVILTDEQAFGSVSYYGGGSVDDALNGFDGFVHTFNLAGYRAAQSKSGSQRRHAFTGLNDSGFKMMSLIEQGQNGTWPWLREVHFD